MAVIEMKAAAAALPQNVLGASVALESLRESDHRIANHLTLLAGMIHTQMRGLAKGPEMVTRADVQSVLREAAGKVLSIGHLHRHLAGQSHSDEIEVGNYLIECIQTLTSSLSLEGRVGFVQRLGASCMLKAEDAQNLGLIVSEVLMNAVKHAHPTGVPTQMSIACDHTADGQMAIEIADDGVGLPETFNSTRDGGVGFKLIRSLAERLGATLTIESDSLGLTFRLVLPLAR